MRQRFKFVCLKFQHAWRLGLSPVCTSATSRLVEYGWLWIEETSSSLIEVLCVCLCVCVCVSVCVCTAQTTTQALQRSDGQYHNTQAGQSTSPCPPIMSS